MNTDVKNNSTLNRSMTERNNDRSNALAALAVVGVLLIASLAYLAYAKMHRNAMEYNNSATTANTPAPGTNAMTNNTATTNPANIPNTGAMSAYPVTNAPAVDTGTTTNNMTDTTTNGAAAGSQ